MDSKIDRTLYNAIKENFSFKKGTVVFISLTSDCIDQLEPKIFKKYKDCCSLLQEHLDNNKPYAGFYGLNGRMDLVYMGKEFGQQECLATGKIAYFELDPFREIIVDIEAVKRELQQLKELLANSKAS